MREKDKETEEKEKEKGGPTVFCSKLCFWKFENVKKLQKEN